MRTEVNQSGRSNRTFVGLSKLRKGNLRMKYSCGYWNRVSVNKIFLEQPSSEPSVKVIIPMYEPLETSKCEKCSKIIAEPKELIRIMKNVEKRWL